MKKDPTNTKLSGTLERRRDLGQVRLRKIVEPPEIKVSGSRSSPGTPAGRTDRAQTFMSWVDKTLKAGGMMAAQYQKYKDAADTAIEIMKSGNVEFAKLGHIGSNEGGKTYDVGQFMFVMKLEGGGLGVQMYIDDDMIETASFLFDQAWFAGTKRGKFFGFYDPAGYSTVTEAKWEFAAKAEARHAARRAALMTGEIDVLPVSTN